MLNGLTSLLAASAAVSLLTLAALLLRRRLPETMRVPSWFLGATQNESERRLRIATPPWLAFFFVLLFTLAACLLFWPPPAETAGAGTRPHALVWVDPTLSAHLSRAQNGFNASAIAARLLEDGNRLHGLRAAPDPQHPLVFRYSIVPLEGTAAVEDFLREEARLLLPYAHPFAEAAALDTLREAKDFQGRAGMFFAVSDGQVETLQSLSFLSQSFRAGRLFSSGSPRVFAGERREIIPSELASAWSAVAKAEADFQFFGPRTTNVGEKTGSLGTPLEIPAQARPGLAIESFPSEPKDALAFVTLKGFSDGALPGEDDAPRGLADGGSLRPLLTACGGGAGGPTELDPASDLRALAGFLGLPFRRETCLEHTIETTENRTSDPWAWRRQSLWVVPLTEEIAGTLAGKGEFWIPRGFEPCCDSLVYTAPLRQTDAPNLESQRTAVQLDDKASPVVLALSPTPPQGALRYPRESIAPEGARETLPESDVFLEFAAAADGTPLAYKARRARVAFVRTGLSMANGELGRSSAWSQLWFSLLDDAGTGHGPRLVTLEPASPSEMSSLAPSAFTAQLSPSTLTFGTPDAYRTLGLFRSQDPKAPLTLVSVSPLERVQSVLAESEFAALWSASAADANAPEASPTGVRPASHVLVGALLAVAALAGLWVLPLFLRGRALRLLVAVTFLVLPPFSRTALAQRGQPGGPGRLFFGRPTSAELPPGSSPSIPFRIGWCDAVIPEDVKARYTALRDLLASRGTIELPTQLVAGGCRPGASELWWASDAAALDLRALADHVTLGGAFVIEGQPEGKPPERLAALETPGIGLRWEQGGRRGLLYRSFYLLASFDGCPQEATWLLSLRKRAGSNTPTGLATRARFLTAGGDCLPPGDDMRERAFVNLIYALLTTDYKEDQLQLPEILSRVRNLGLEP